MKDQKSLEQISKKLSVLIALNLITSSSKATITESIKILSRFGLSSQEIAEILNTSKGMVDVTRSRIKSKKK